MKTYTIATANDMLIAIIPDGQDTAAEVARTAQEAGVTLDDCDIISGLILTNTDDRMYDDEIVFRGGKMGHITDEKGVSYLYAVKRTEYDAHMAATMRRSDAELDAYFGGRAAYLQQLREDIEAAKARLAGGFAADEARVAPEISAFFSAPSMEEWTAQRKGVIRNLELTLAANL